jgi:peptidoglycan/xylan/chitin deacetylase (PgdA/CDA1 family)
MPRIWFLVLKVGAKLLLAYCERKHYMRRAVEGRMGRSLASIGWHLPLIRLIVPSHPTVLLYHNVLRTAGGSFIDARCFERHVAFLTKNFECISAGRLEDSGGRADRTQVLLTFDDGMRNNFEVVVPILARYRVPAIFFISSRHAVRGRYLWFVYLHALKKYFPHDGFLFRGKYLDMRDEVRECTMSRLTDYLTSLDPHPIAMTDVIQEELPPLEDFMSTQQLRDECEGMTSEQVGELANSELFSVGCHTVDHPFLTRCEPEEMRRQIEENKRWLETVSGVRCDAMAYPLSDYNAPVLDLCRELSFSQGYAVSPTLRSMPELEIPRIGIYSTSLEILGFKAVWGNVLRAARISVG